MPEDFPFDDNVKDFIAWDFGNVFSPQDGVDYILDRIEYEDKPSEVLESPLADSITAAYIWWGERYRDGTDGPLFIDALTEALVKRACGNMLALEEDAHYYEETVKNQPTGSWKEDVLVWDIQELESAYILINKMKDYAREIRSR